jgi:tetratricopeptide (TPR) repeat protein
MTTALAPDEELGEAIAALEADRDGAEAALDTLSSKYPDDPRLHFMKGSILAGSGRSIEAHRALARAVELAPDYALARYQLGFFELTSGEPQKALGTWGPLLAEPEGNYLRKFVEGMAHLIRDEFAPAIATFEQGIALNTENEPMNNDIRLLIDECRKLQRGSVGRDNADSELSATSFMLDQLGGKKTLQ